MASLSTITEGKLTVGSDIPYPPFEFGRAPDYEGFDVDVVNEIAKRLDLEAEFVKTPFDPIFRNLAQGQVRHGRVGRDDHAGAREGRSTSRIRTSRPTSR